MYAAISLSQNAMRICTYTGNIFDCQRILDFAH
jgi:hypothetical protein